MSEGKPMEYVCPICNKLLIILPDDYGYTYTCVDADCPVNKEYLTVNFLEAYSLKKLGESLPAPSAPENVRDLAREVGKIIERWEFGHKSKPAIDEAAALIQAHVDAIMIKCIQAEQETWREAADERNAKLAALTAQAQAMEIELAAQGALVISHEGHIETQDKTIAALTAKVERMRDGLKTAMLYIDMVRAKSSDEATQDEAERDYLKCAALADEKVEK
jgi:hypothetical protein